jgi:hypothetical protein
MTSDVPGTGQPDPAEPTPPSADASPTEVIQPVPGAPAPEPPPPTDWTLRSSPASAAAEATPPAPPAPEPPAGQPPGGPPATQPGQWGAAPQQPGWAPGPVAPGGAPAGGWSPAPATSSGNGCLKACIIVAIVLVVIAVIGVGALFLLGRQLVSDLGVDPETGATRECPIVSNDELNQIFGSDDAAALPMGGLVDATIGQVLDKRVLKDAEDCWILGSGTGTAVTGRIAAQDGVNASGDFQAAKAAAQAGEFFGGDVSGYGDEAFCTGGSTALSFGILVRSGGRLAYVSLIDNTRAIGDWEETDDGVTISPDTCQLAGEIANAALR